MRSVIILALLWQTAVVLGLGAIHAPDNNNRASSALPWVGKEVWMTDIKASPEQVFTTGGELQLYLYSLNDTNCIETRKTLNMNDGSETSSTAFGACLFFVAQQLPFVATLDNTIGVKVYAGNSSSVTPIMSLPPLSRSGEIFSVGDHFFWFASGDQETTLTKIDPRARTSTTSKVPFTSGFVFAGLNHLFVISPATYTVYCYSAATGEVIWTVSQPGRVNVVPAPSSDTVLLVFANSSSSLFNSATGEWIWTVNVPVEIVGNGASLTASFVANTVILNVNRGFEMGRTNTTAVDVTSGKILWEAVGGTNNAPSFTCGLKSNIFIALVVTGDSDWFPTYSLIGLDVKTGKKVLDYTPALGVKFALIDTILCQNDDLYFVAVGKFSNHAIVQRIAFAPHP